MFCVDFCPRTVMVRPSSGPFKAGDVLTCTSDGYEPSYQWTDSDGVVVSTAANITLTGSHFMLTCIATGSFNKPCTASKSISDKSTSSPAEGLILYCVV